MKTHTAHTTLFELPNNVEVELPIPPDTIMEYNEPLIHVGKDTITVAYLAHDDDAEDPQDNDDYFGHIYNCRRHSSSLKDYERVLGLRDGGPDLYLVNEDKAVEEAINRICNDPADLARVAEWCRDHWEQADGCTDEKFIEGNLCRLNELAPVFDTDALLLEMWQEGRHDGTIGDPHAVLLDVFEHGQVCYSVSGHGPQCDFDTARAGACWVPSQYGREELLRRAEVYRLGKITKATLQGKTHYYVSVFDPEGKPVPTHDCLEWHNAFEALSKVKCGWNQPQQEAEAQAARELATQAAATYTDWCNGNTFITVVVTYDLDGNEIDYDTCGGYIGDDSAFEALQEAFKEKVQ